MMKVTSKVNKSFLKQFNDKALMNLIKTADALKSDLIESQTMPFDTGQAQNRSTFVDDSTKLSGKVKIITDTPYARKIYFHPEFNFQKGKNPNAGGLWFEPYITGVKKDFASKTFARFMRSGL